MSASPRRLVRPEPRRYSVIEEQAAAGEDEAEGDKAMLFLTRKVGESVVINDNIELTVVEVRGKSIKLGFTFPPEAKVLRRELHERIKAESDGVANGAGVTVPIVEEPTG
jgi:carbon storage regulator